MINIIFIPILINLFIHYITKTPYRSLNCGLWGYFGETNKQFNWKDFNFIGLLNDYRGGDAAGRSVGKEYQHFNINALNTYAKIATKLINPAYRDNKIILGHTRKTSANAVTTYGIQYTQPYPIRENNDIVGIGMHNGTIYNSNDLKDKYNVPDKLEYIDADGIKTSNTVNDSQILFYALIVNQDYSILEDYEGSAALAWYDFNEEQLYLYRGESRQSINAQEESEERPLYYIQNKNHLWFSSDKDPLILIKGNKCNDVIKVPANKICVFKDGIKINEIGITRKCGQYKSYKQHQPKHSYDDYSFWEKDSIQRKLPFLIDNGDADRFSNNKLESEKIPFMFKSIGYAKGRYWMNEKKLAHGIIHLHENGNISEFPLYNTKPYYFIDGVMINGHEAFNTLIRKYNKLATGLTCNLFVSRIVIKESTHPVHRIGWDTMYEYDTNYESSLKPLEGEFQPLFSSKIYKFSDGKLTGIILSNYKFANHSKINNENVDNDVNNYYESDSTYTNSEDDLIQKEVVSILKTLLNDVNRCNNELTIFSGSDSGDEAIYRLAKIEELILSFDNNE